MKFVPKMCTSVLFLFKKVILFHCRHYCTALRTKRLREKRARNKDHRIWNQAFEKIPSLGAEYVRVI